MIRFDLAFQRSHHMLPKTLLFARPIVASLTLAALAVLLVCRFSNLRAADSSSTRVPAAEIPVAHSALLTVGATQTDDSVSFSVRRVHDHSIVSSDDVMVTVDG